WRELDSLAARSALLSHPTSCAIWPGMGRRSCASKYSRHSSIPNACAASATCSRTWAQWLWRHPRGQNAGPSTTSTMEPDCPADHDQSGALNESFSDVFGSLVKQWKLKQTADKADWLIGAGLLSKSVNGVALRSMKAPGTAYDDPQLGKDPQPAHMKDYFKGN